MRGGCLYNPHARALFTVAENSQHRPFYDARKFSRACVIPVLKAHQGQDP